MKFKLLVMIIVIINLIGCSASDTLDTEEKVREQVNTYLKAVESKDIDTMVKYADDLRFPDKIQQKSEYQTISQKIDKALIKDLRKINNTEYSVTITTEENGKMDEYTFPIKYVNQDWIIIVGQERNRMDK
ncbi:hypothetical protein PMSD_06430 [Paenibacillus macquariensis subsp. defensor]|nr:hypothetical protein PMSD_06430 [Paenibacillus macquariensis subsp. defensor]